VQNCSQPCTYNQGKLAQQTSAAAHVCTTATGCLFVTDKSSKQRFLIDTGSDLCVFPRKLRPLRGQRHYHPHLRVAAPQPQPGITREFTWRFVVADVAHPLIGADFLSYFGLLVDCRNNRLLDGVTSLSAPAQAASSLVPSVKVISGGASVDTLLSEFPDLI
jgi:hypothetical protein